MKTHICPKCKSDKGVLLIEVQLPAIAKFDMVSGEIMGVELKSFKDGINVNWSDKVKCFFCEHEGMLEDFEVENNLPKEV